MPGDQGMMDITNSCTESKHIVFVLTPPTFNMDAQVVSLRCKPHESSDHITLEPQNIFFQSLSM